MIVNGKEFTIRLLGIGDLWALGALYSGGLQLFTGTLFIDSAPRLGAHLAANAQTLWTIDTSLVTGPAKN